MSIDGVPVSGAEIRSRLGLDADSVLRLSLLDEATQRTFAAGAGPASPHDAPAVNAPAPVEMLDGRRIVSRSFGAAAATIASESDRAVSPSRRARSCVATPSPSAVIFESSARCAAMPSRLAEALNSVRARSCREMWSWSVARCNGIQRRASMERCRKSGGARPDSTTGGAGRGSGVRPPSPILGPSFALAVTIARVALVCLLAALILLLGRDYVERIGARAAAEPIKAGAIGLLAQILFLPLLVATIVMLVVTIIGIPLLVLVPFVILGFVVIALVGFTSVAHCVGRLFTAKVGWTSGAQYAATIAGVLVLVSPLLLARCAGLVLPMTFGLGIIGSLVEYLAWTVGFGAVALTRFSKMSGMSGMSGTGGTSATSGPSPAGA